MGKKRLTKKELFLKLAKPNKNGKSRWVNVSEFVDEYADLKLGNGGSWNRKEGGLAKQYIVETDKSKTPGNSIDRIRLNGLNNSDYSQNIKASIKNEIKKHRCVILGTSNPEVDHKNGLKNDPRVMKNIDQRITDFQPLSKAANNAKKQCCKVCKKTKKRFDAKTLGYPISFYKGTAKQNFKIDSYL